MRRFFTLLVPAALLAALLAASGGIARTYASAAQPQWLHVTCIGNGCNGLDPETTGCAGDAYTVRVPGGTASFDTGSIELRYSPTCGTNWGRVLSSVGFTRLTVSIRRDDKLFYFAVRSGTRWWSPMVYAPNEKAKACGSAGHFGDCTESI